LVPPGDVHALAGAILRVLADEQLARRLGAAGQERVARLFRWEAAARAMLAVYEDLRCSGPS
jgi:glycosyltransferase involved in cell wall biosynthesis